jgi:hypothetical protein
VKQVFVFLGRATSLALHRGRVRSSSKGAFFLGHFLSDELLSKLFFRAKKVMSFAKEPKVTYFALAAL